MLPLTQFPHLHCKGIPANNKFASFEEQQSLHKNKSSLRGGNNQGKTIFPHKYTQSYLTLSVVLVICYHSENICIHLPQPLSLQKIKRINSIDYSRSFIALTNLGFQLILLFLGKIINHLIGITKVICKDTLLSSAILQRIGNAIIKGHHLSQPT